MNLADDTKGVLLVIGAKVTAGQLLADRALMPSDPEVFMKREKKLQKKACIHFV